MKKANTMGEKGKKEEEGNQGVVLTARVDDVNLPVVVRHPADRNQPAHDPPHDRDPGVAFGQYPPALVLNLPPHALDAHVADPLHQVLAHEVEPPPAARRYDLRVGEVEDGRGGGAQDGEVPRLAAGAEVKGALGPGGGQEGAGVSELLVGVAVVAREEAGLGEVTVAAEGRYACIRRRRWRVEY